MDMTTGVTNSRTVRIIMIGLALLLAAFAIGASTTRAQSLDCTANSWSVQNETELNEAIGCFNGKVTAGSYTITLAQDISLASSTTIVYNGTSGVELVIEGDGHAVDGQDTAGVRPFQVAVNTTVTMNQLTVTGGNIPSDKGGGVYNDGTLTISKSTISGNSALAGGGIENRGTLTVFNSTISGNSASGSPGGGGIANGFGSMLTLDSVTISANSDTSATGAGGLWTANATATLRNSILAGNSGNDCVALTGVSVTDGGHNLVLTQVNCGLTNGVNGNIVGVPAQLGPLANNGGGTFTHSLLAGSPAIDAGDTLEPTDQRGQPRPFGLADDIGALELQTCYVDSWSVANEAELNAAIACYNSKTAAGSYTITLTQDILLSDRQIDRSTTAIDNATAGVELVIEGSGFAVDGQDKFDVRPITVQADTTVTINDLTATGGNVLVGSGVDSRGGGILNRGNLTLNRSTVSDNATETRGGGLATQGGTVQINDSTIANNISGTPSNPGNGGGIYNDNGQVTIRNSTISGNETDGFPSMGGGITNYDNMTLESVTITENGASDGGGIYFNATRPVTLTIKNSILAGNGFADCYFNTISGGATIDDLGYNLVQADDQLNPCGFVGGVNNNLVTVPFLLPLADNGGPTETHALALDSPAIDAGDSSLPTDQRGVARPQGAADDIGAYESQACDETSWFVTRLSQLDAAIECFNAKTSPGIYTINITHGFPAVASTTPIDNSTPGVSLVIEGSGNSVDWNGDLIPGTRPFLIQANTTVTINDLAINNGNVIGTERGGGIRNLGNLTLNRTIIRGNRAENNGGGISNVGELVINDSTIAGNEVQGGSTGVSGGGIDNVGSLTIRNSTISGNTSSNDGGGISNGGTLNLDSVTVTDNTALGAVDGAEGAGLQMIGFAAATSRNSILAGNSGAEDCDNLFGTITDGGHNLVQTQNNCGFVDGANGSIVGQDPLLGPLRNNGGPTLTHALLTGSPAISAGDTDLTTDQRGIARPQGGTDDIGAFEVEAGTIIIEKKTAPAGGTGFGFTDNIETPNAFTLNDGQNKTFLSVLPGSYVVTEDPQQDSFLSALRCDDGASQNPSTVDLAAREANIKLDPGETVICTFTNTEDDHIVIGKVTFPAGGTDFDFSGDLGSFTLDDGDVEIQAVEPGTFTITEQDPGPDYDLTALECAIIDSQSGISYVSGDLNTGSVELTLTGPGQTAYCLFENTERGNITIVKEADPSDGTEFDFTLGGDASESFALVDGDSQDYLLPVGVYVITELVPDGWENTDIVCEYGDSTVTYNFGESEAFVALAPGDDVTCTYYNEKSGSISIVKDADPADDTAFEFAILDQFGNGDLFILQDPSDPSYTASNVRTGPYLVAEQPSDGWVVSDIACQSTLGSSKFYKSVAEGVLEIDLAGGDDVTCTFSNREKTVQITESFAVTRVEEGKLSGEGSQACYWLTLSAPPLGGEVVVDIGPPQNGQVKLNKKSVTLNDSNWNNLSTSERSNFVCVRAVEDQIDDGGAPICRDGNSDMVGNGALVPNKECGDHTDDIPHSIANSSVPGLTAFERKQPNGSFAPGSTIQALIEDDDTAGVILTESYAVSDLDENGTPTGKACYWVNLTSQPMAPVTIDVSGVKVDTAPAQITLDAGNWDTLDPQVKSNQVCLTPQDNSVIEPDGNFCAPKNSDIFGRGGNAGQICGDYLGKVSHTVTSGDSTYNGTSNIVTNGPNLDSDETTIDVLIRNEDAPALNTAPATISILEGSSASYEVSLTAQPDGSVKVSDGRKTATFTASNWNQPEVFTTSAAQNNAIDGTRQEAIHLQVGGSDANFQSITPEPVLVTVVDDDSAGLLFSAAEVAAVEGGSEGAYTMHLTSKPRSNVTVTLSPDRQTAVTPATLTFTPTNWQQARTVTVKAVDDLVAETGDQSGVIAHAVSSADNDYNNLPGGEVVARIADNDTAAVLASASSLEVSEDGAAATYRLRLQSEPAVPVEVRLLGGEQLLASPAKLRFTPSNWDQEQQVTVRAVDNAIDEGATVGGLLAYSLSGDDVYANLDVEDLLVVIQNNDRAGVVISPTELKLSTGQSREYKVHLASQPTGDVAVFLEPGSGLRLGTPPCDAEGGQCLLFTPQNWAAGQRVRVTMEQALEGRVKIEHGAASSDPFYQDVAAASVNIYGTSMIELFLPVVRR